MLQSGADVVVDKRAEMETRAKAQMKVEKKEQGTGRKWTRMTPTRQHDALVETGQ